MLNTTISILEPQSRLLDLLALNYATSFWAGAWKELLKDGNGNQYGTYDLLGNIYPETLDILRQNGIKPESDWPIQLWHRAGQEEIYRDGVRLYQFWSLAQATRVLLEFVIPISGGGYGGNIMLLQSGKQILGFTAYTVPYSPELGLQMAQKRFPPLLLKPGSSDPQNLTQLLIQLVPNKRIGTYLDFAICEGFRGQGYGSQLFDVRLEQMLKLDAEVVVGRTIKTSPAQYYGNYVARGMKVLATDCDNPDKTVFYVERDQVKSR